MNARAVAAKVLTQVLREHRSLEDAFKLQALLQLPPHDISFVKELCFGTLRFYVRLLDISKVLLHKPLARKQTDVLCLLLSGLYQLLYLKTPHYAAISESVNAAKTLKPWASGLINKTLRLFCQKQEEILHAVDKNEAAKYSHPAWLINAIKKDWPEQAPDIFTANNSKAPLFLRSNPALISRDAYLKKLAHSQISAHPLPALPYAIALEEGVPITKLPDFDKGACYIQDIAGQYVPGLLQLKEGLSVLDACAAPGGKTSDILASMPTLGKLVAIDQDTARLQKIRENIKRLHLAHAQLELIEANAIQTNSWSQGQTFDRILIDAPCSATGVIRRHPDIKLLRKPTDIPRLCEQQQQLLQALWPLLNPGGLLLYTTCSILNAENEAIIEAFLRTHSEANVIPISLDRGVTQQRGVQLLPKIDGEDGFYYALLQKC